MNKLKDWFEAHDGRKIIKLSNYLDIYEKHFAKFIDRKPCILEIGVCHGGSLQMWKAYFGAGCHVNGIDINPSCIEVEEDGRRRILNTSAGLRNPTAIPLVRFLVAGQIQRPLSNNNSD